MTVVEPEVTTSAEVDEGSEHSQLLILHELREQTRLLVGQLDGAVHRVSLSVGTCAVEVEWAAREPAPARSTAGRDSLTVHDNVFAERRESIVDARNSAQEGGGTGAEVGSMERVTAPLVGTYYRAPHPGARPFIEVGDIVEPGQTLAILEAMKLMNPIIAEGRARVMAIHVRDGDIVEYDQALVDLLPVEAEG